MAGGKRKAEEELDRGDGYGSGTKGASRIQGGPDNSRKAECLSNVTALNAQFASWVAKQKEERPFDLWRAGVQDYLTHAEKILHEFTDVVDWLSSSSGQNGSADITAAAEPPKEHFGSGASLSWGAAPVGKTQEAPAANGTQKSLFSWAPALKKDESEGMKAGEKGGVNAISKGEQKAGSLPGWGSAFGSEKQVKEKPGTAAEGKKSSIFQFPSAATSSAAPTNPSLFPASAFQFANKLIPPAEKAPTSVSSFFPKVAEDPPSTSALFSVPAFPSTTAPAKPTEVKLAFPSTTASSKLAEAKLATPDWAAAFGKPAAASSAAPTFSLPGAKSAAGPLSLSVKTNGAKEGEEQDDKKEGADEGDTPAEPPSPSFKASEEEGVENVLDTPIKVWRRSTSSGGEWENQGTGSLTLKRDKNAPRQSKKANARVVFRNLGGKVLLNARLYVGMKLEVQNGALHAILHATEQSTPAKGEAADKPAEPAAEVVSRLYAFRQPKKGGIAAEDLKAALEKEVPKEEAPNSDAPGKSD